MEALTELLTSAREIVSDLANGSTQRALRALASIPPEQRDGIAAVLERASVAWRTNEAFAHLHQTRLRLNPHAQLFVRVFDPVPEPTHEDPDVLPETLRVMRRLGLLLTPEARASWEPSVTAALEILTPEERDACVTFLVRALELVQTGPDPTRPA